MVPRIEPLAVCAVKSCRCLFSGLLPLRLMETHFKLSTRENGVGHHDRESSGALKRRRIQVLKWYQ